MTDKVKCEIYVAMNENREYVACECADEVESILRENKGGDLCRIVKLKVWMTPPSIEEGPEVDIPDKAGETKRIEAEAV